VSSSNTVYQIISTNDLRDVVFQLNGILNQIADRLDKIEGFRDTLETDSAKFDGDVTINADLIVNDSTAAKIHSME